MPTPMAKMTQYVSGPVLEFRGYVAGMTQWEAIKWPEDMAPSRCPIHFTNELEVAASPETIRSLLAAPKVWPSFYPGVEHVQLRDGHESPRLGTEFEANLAGQDVSASAPEFEPKTRIAWSGCPKVSEESRAYHAWIVTPTPNGCHLWTEETMRGPFRIELAKALAPRGDARRRGGQDIVAASARPGSLMTRTNETRQSLTE
jgi:hypothetical protein